MTAQVRANFRPEFVNRIDEYIVFEGLKREQIKQIVRIQARRVAERLAVKKISLELKDSAVDYLAVSTCPLLAAHTVLSNSCVPNGTSLVSVPPLEVVRPHLEACTVSCDSMRRVFNCIGCMQPGLLEGKLVPCHFQCLKVHASLYSEDRGP